MQYYENVCSSDSIFWMEVPAVESNNYYCIFIGTQTSYQNRTPTPLLINCKYAGVLESQPDSCIDSQIAFQRQFGEYSHCGVLDDLFGARDKNKSKFE